MSLHDENKFLRHAAFCQIIEALTSDATKKDLQIAIEFSGGEPENLKLLTFGTTAPPVVMFNSRGEFYVICRGVEELSQARDYLLGARATPDSPTGHDPVPNEFLRQRAVGLLATYQQFRFDHNTVEHFVGHSYGGALAQVLFVEVFGFGNPVNAEVVTFGSPKPGNIGWSASWTHQRTYRWINQDDNIVALPPHLGAAPFYQLALDTDTVLAWDQQAHTLGGTVLIAGSELMASDGEWPTTIFLDNPVNDLFSTDRKAISAVHNINAYRRALIGHVVPESRNWSQNQSAAPFKGEIYLDDPLLFIPFLMAQIEKMNANENIGGSPVTTVIPLQYKFRVGRAGDDHAVIWLDRVVLAIKTRAAARIACKHGNAFLRRMQVSGALYSSNLQLSLADYLAVCLDSTKGFRPIPIGR